MTRAAAALAFVAAATTTAGCLALDDIPRDTCGNFVVDEAEDCDSHDDATCRDCTFVCFTTGTDPSCPTGYELSGVGECCPSGYTCGNDELCHKPSGLFHATDDVLAPSIDDLAVAAIDRGPHQAAVKPMNLEVVGIGDKRIQVLFPDPAGVIDSTQDVLVDASIASWAVSDLDRDSIDELVTTTSDGLIGFSGASGTLAAYPFATFSIPDPSIVTGVPPRVVFHVDGTPQTLPLLVADHIDPACTTADGACSAVVSLGLTGVVASPPCGSNGISTAEIVGDRLALTGTPSGEELAIGFHHDDVLTGTFDDRVCVYYPVGSPPIAQSWDPVTLPVGFRVNPAGSLLLTRLGTDVCPSLVAPLLDSSGLPVVGLARRTTAAPPCSIQSALVVVAGTDNQAPLYAGDLDGAPGDELIVTDGLGTLTTAPSFSYTLYGPRPWASAAIGDVNGDGRPDVVATGIGDPDELGGAPDIDLGRQTPTGEFLGSRIIIDAGVDRVRTGDVDGDAFDDVIYLTSPGVGLTRTLSVAFGAPNGGQPDIVVESNVVDAVSDVIPVRLGDATGQQDPITDIVFATQNGGTVMYGSWTRQLTAPILLDAIGDPQTGVVAIAPGDVDGNLETDIMVIDALGRLFALIKQFGPLTGANDPLDAHDLGLIGSPVAPGLLRTGRTAAMDHDVLVGVTGGENPRLMVGEIIGLGEFPDPDGPSLRMLTAAPIPLAIDAVDEVRVVDYDGDDELDVMIDTAMSSWWFELAPTDWHLTNAVELTVPGMIAEMPEFCVTSTLIDLDGAHAGPELVVACLDGRIRRYDPQAPSKGFEAPGQIDHMLAGDVTGDGLDDLIVLSELPKRITIYAQCSTRDPAPCAADTDLGPDGVGMR